MQNNNMEKANVSYQKNLKSVLVCSPKFFKVVTPINNTEKQTFKNTISVAKLEKEHEQFVNQLKKLHIQTLFIPAQEHSPQQTFVRDLGFVLNDKLFLGKTKIGLRSEEVNALCQELPHDQPMYEFNHELEGGDVVIFQNTIFVGVSERTKLDSAIELKQAVGNHFNVVPLKLHKDVLHLDCVLNAVGNCLVVNQRGIVTKFNPYEYAKHVVHAYQSEQFYLPTNFLAVNSHTIVANKLCPRTNAALKKLGVTVVEVQFSELVKLGGAFRCCTLEWQTEP